MIKSTILFSFATITLLTFSPVARAGVLAEFSLPQVQPAIVTPNDTFSIAVEGANYNDASYVALVKPITATFNGLGAAGAQTFSGYALGNQNVTITTTQTVSGTSVTDAITLSVPTNLSPVGTTTNSGMVTNEIDLYLGMSVAGTNTLDFTPALPSMFTDTASIQSTGLVPLNPSVFTSNNNGSLGVFVNFDSGYQQGASGNFFKAYNFSITYDAVVPEPSTWALLAGGLAGLSGVGLRQRRRARCA